MQERMPGALGDMVEKIQAMTQPDAPEQPRMLSDNEITAVHRMIAETVEQILGEHVAPDSPMGRFSETVLQAFDNTARVEAIREHRYMVEGDSPTAEPSPGSPGE